MNKNKVMAGQKKNILIVEDEESLAYVIRRVFRTESDRFSVKIVGTIREALVYCEAVVPDLIVADLLLPDGKGYELCSIELKGQRIPTVIMTGYEDERLVQKSKESGAIDYIMKTESSLLELPRIVDRILREQDLQTYL